VTDICLGKVGAVATRGVSRFARNSRDWQQLIEMCRVVDTVLIDQEAVYTPRQGNDRLLLGLKGSLNGGFALMGLCTSKGNTLFPPDDEPRRCDDRTIPKFSSHEAHRSRARCPALEFQNPLTVRSPPVESQVQFM
jgi:hypothetical protein